MDINYDKRFFENYIKKLNENQVNQIYNIQNQPNIKPHSLQFKQLIAFYNFKKKLNEDLSKEVSIQNNQIIPNEINNKMYLIDKNWIQKWKKHVGYEKVKEKCIKYNLNNRELNDSDYNWIEPIINKHSTNILLSPLDNINLFNNNEINPLADFIVVDENCYKLFTIGSKNENNELMNKFFKIKIYKEKFILIINEKIFLLIFKENISKQYFELLIIFQDKCQNINKVLLDIEKYDINELVKKINIDLTSEMKKSINKYGYIFEIINKTLLSYRNKNLRNTIVPTFSRGAEELLNAKGKISKNLKNLMKSKVANNLDQMNYNQIQNISNPENEIKNHQIENQKKGNNV
jgi:hypothetical protein